MPNWCVLLILALWCSSSGFPQAASQPASERSEVAHAYVDKAGHVHIAYKDGRDMRIPGEKDQVSCDPPVVAPDRKTVAWTVLFPNCCTSYPIPTTLLIYRNGRIVQRISDGMMVYSWRFRDGGRRLAVSTGTVHGMQGVNLTLYDARTGNAIATWHGDPTETPPPWGAGVAH